MEGMVGEASLAVTKDRAGGRGAGLSVTGRAVAIDKLPSFSYGGGDITERGGTTPTPSHVLLAHLASEHAASAVQKLNSGSLVGVGTTSWMEDEY